MISMLNSRPNCSWSDNLLVHLCLSLSIKFIILYGKLLLLIDGELSNPGHRETVDRARKEGD